MLEFFTHLAANAFGIYAADYILSDFIFNGNFGDLLLISFFLSLIQFFIRPVLKIITFPIILVTFGIFNIFINIFLLWLLTLIVPPTIMTIIGFWTYALAAIIISAVNIFFNHYFKKYSTEQ